MEDVILAEGFQGQLWLEESKKVKKHVAVEGAPFIDVHQMPVIIYHNHPPKTIEVENKDFKEFVQKRTSARKDDNANDKTSTDPSVVIAEPPTHEPAANEVYSALQSPIPNNFSLQMQATQRAHQLSDPITRSDISPISSPGMIFSDHFFHYLLNNTNADLMSWEDDDLMSLETVATKPALQLSDPIPTSDISPIPSPGMRFSHNCFKNHLSREDVMSLETPANRARPSTFRDWDELYRSSEQYK